MMSSLESVDKTRIINTENTPHTKYALSKSLKLRFCYLQEQLVLIVFSSVVVGSVLVCVNFIRFPSRFEKSNEVPNPQRHSTTTVKHGPIFHNDNSGFEDPKVSYTLPQDNNDTKDHIVISSPLQLYGIKEFTKTVTVKSLIPQTTPSGISKLGGKSVKNLELIGPISQPWLLYILSCFKNLTYITIDTDKVCSNLGGKFINTTVELPQLDTMVVTNSNKCPIMSWGFEINTPVLKAIQISKASLTFDNYKSLYQLLNKTSSTIQGIEISESSICSKCDFTGLHFDHLKFLKITKTIDESFLDEEDD